MQITSAAKNMSIWTFMKEIRLVVTVREKKVFVSRDESELIAQFGIFGYHTSNTTIQGSQKRTSKPNSPPKVRFVPLRR